MGYEGVPKKTTEAPIVHVGDDGEMIPLNAEGAQRTQELTEEDLLRLEAQHADRSVRRSLRLTLAALGVSVIPGDTETVRHSPHTNVADSDAKAERQEDISEQLPEGIYETANGPYATTAPKHSLRPKARPEDVSSTVQNASESAIEWGADSEQFAKRVAGYVEWWKLEDGHYQFVDRETGAPLGPPVGPQEFIVDMYDKSSQLEDQYAENAYRLTATEPRTWLPFMARQQGIPNDSWEQLNVNVAFAAARANDAEPKLQQGIENGSIKTNFDIVEYFGMNEDRTVEGDVENRTYAEFVRDELPQHLDIDDPIVKDSVLKYAIGLIAKESRFNNKLGKNAATAQQACQLIDEVRAEYLFTWDNSLSQTENERQRQSIIDRTLTFPEEVALMGKKFSDVYKRVPHWIDHGYEKIDGNWQQTDRVGNLDTLKARYASDEDWKRYGLVPLMIVAYNTGELRVGDMVDAYIKKNADVVTTSSRDIEGYDLYYDISYQAAESNEGRLKDFGPDGVAYVPMIFAATEMVAQQHPELMRESYQTQAHNTL